MVKRKWKAVLVALFLVGVLCSCEDDHDRDYRRADKTPSGFHVQFDDLGTLSTGLMTKNEIFRLFDKAFLEAGDIFEIKNGVPLQDFLAAPHDHRIVFRLVDHWHYFSPYNGWVAGEAYDRETVFLSFWTQRLLPLNQFVSNPWTIDSNQTGQLYYGDFPGAGSFAALIAHEMGHVFFGPQFGH